MDTTEIITISDNIKDHYTLLEENQYKNADIAKREPGYLAWYWHVTIIIVIDIICLVGNGVTLYIYIIHRQKYTSRAYVIALAVLDICACLVILPFYAYTNKSVEMTENDDLFLKAFFGLSAAASNGYTSMLNATALDRVFAVCFPLIYTQYYKLRTVLSLIFVFIMSCYAGLLMAIIKNHENWHYSPADNIIMGQMAVQWIMIIMCYSVVTATLSKRSRQMKMRVGAVPSMQSKHSTLVRRTTQLDIER